MISVDSQTMMALVKQRHLHHLKRGDYGGDYVDKSGNVFASWMGGMQGLETSAADYWYFVKELPDEYLQIVSRQISETERHLINDMLRLRRLGKQVEYTILPESRQLYEQCIAKNMWRLEGATISYYKNVNPYDIYRQ